MEMRAPPRCEHDVDAAPRELARDRRTDPTRCAGDKRALALEIGHARKVSPGPRRSEPSGLVSGRVDSLQLEIHKALQKYVVQ